MEEVPQDQKQLVACCKICILVFYTEHRFPRKF